MKKYRKKPVVIEAVQLTRRNFDLVVENLGTATIGESNSGEFAEDSCYIEIVTLEGTMTAEENDWIIRGIKGEFYPCKPDIFEKTYEKVTEE